MSSSPADKALSAVVIEEMDGGSCEEGFITVRVRLLFPRMPLYERSFQNDSSTTAFTLLLLYPCTASERAERVSVRSKLDQHRPPPFHPLHNLLVK